MIEVTVAGLGIAPPSSVPLLLLKERQGDRVLPVGIGPLEAQAIVMPLQGVRPPRPMTHDIFDEILASLGGHLRRVEITDLIERQPDEVAQTLRSYASAGRTMFLSIHQIKDAARVCDRFVLLSGGTIRGEGTFDQLASQASARGTATGDLEEVFLALT